MDVTDCTILLVDDEEANLDLLEVLLEANGFTHLARVDDAREAVAAFEAARPDLVLLDLHMPHRSGFEVLDALRARVSASDFLPVLVLTADITAAARDRALAGGAHDFVAKPFDRGEVLLRVRNLLRTRLLHLAQRHARAVAERVAERERLLADASRVLGAAYDSTTALAELGPVLVPALADALAVDLRRDDGWSRAAEAGRASLLPAPPGGDATNGDMANGEAASAGSTEDAPRVLRLTLTASGGSSQGHLLVARGDERAPFSDDERALAAEVARRTGLAVEGARLFREAHEAVAAREHVLAVVAHDLRNPLAAARLYLDRLQGDAGDADAASQAELVERAQRTLVRMDGLIEDLLDGARLARGKLVLDRRPHAIGALLAEAVVLLRPVVERRQLHFEVDGPDELPTLVVDARRLLQALSNLVGNAAKFADEQVRLTWALDADELRITVQDDGPGLRPDQLPHVFSPFWQARPADQRGLGLGLTIALSVVEEHGGRLWVDSAGAGATFVLTLPLDPGAPGRGARKPGSLAGQRAS
jgi:signal transduction histidine kinase/DNA-binding NarL/FixJ family response regulator